MRLKARDLDIATGGPLIAIMHEDEAKALDIHVGDRIRLTNNRRFCHAVIDLTASTKFAPEGTIILVDEVLKKLRLRKDQYVNIELAGKPSSIQFIKKKLDGFKLTESEITQIVQDIVDKRLSDVELTYFVSACYTHMLDTSETVALTKAMINTGDRLHFKTKPIVDKHCIGGVAGNRTTPIVVPILAAAGLTVPKTSSRSITSPAGTADTVEVFCPVSFPIEKMQKIIKKTGACMVWGGAINLAPADDVIIRVEHPLSIDARSQLLASILAKKASVSSTHVLIDIPVGVGAKIENRKHALSLKSAFERIGKAVGLKIFTVITDGSQPIGNGFGPALEARDIIHVLSGSHHAPLDLKRKSIILAGKMLEMAGKAKKGKGFQKALKIVQSGQAYVKFFEIIKAQGGRQVDAEDIKIGKYTHDVKAPHTGIITHIDNKGISKIARIAGAPKNSGAGLFLHVRKRDYVKKDDVLFTIYSESRARLNFAIDLQKKIHDIEIKDA